MIDEIQARIKELEEALISLDNKDDINSARNLCAMMAEGEGGYVEVYRTMARSALEKIDLARKALERK